MNIHTVPCKAYSLNKSAHVKVIRFVFLSQRCNYNADSMQHACMHINVSVCAFKLNYYTIMHLYTMHYVSMYISFIQESICLRTYQCQDSLGHLLFLTSGLSDIIILYNYIYVYNT